jgi:hypothetical protein
MRCNSVIFVNLNTNFYFTRVYNKMSGGIRDLIQKCDIYPVTEINQYILYFLNKN